MKAYLFLILLALGMAFVAGFLSVSENRASLIPTDVVREIQSRKEQFRKSYAPLSEINLSALFPKGDPIAFLDPETVLPLLRDYPFEVFSVLFQQAESCTAPRLPLSRTTQDEVLRKAEEWQRFRCGVEAKLPEGFFDSPPFFHPLGKSYILIAAQSGADPVWIQEHLALLHALELSEIPGSTLNIEGPRKILAGLGLPALKAIAAKDPIVTSDKYLLYRQGNGAEGEPGLKPNSLRYAVFPVSAWHSFWSSTPFYPGIRSPGSSCLLQEGQLCWLPQGREDELRRPTLLLFASSLMLSILCVSLAFREIRRQRSEEERKRFALQTLTHELRTPVSSLLLSSEEVIDRFDSVPEPLQPIVLGMCNEVHRLQRLVEASRGYLSSEAGLVRIQAQSIPSLINYLESVLEPYGNGVAVTFPKQDQSFHTDGYWLGVCLKNLIENALQHGSPPVQVEFNVRDQKLEVSVQDAGVCTFQRFEELAKPFAKTQSSTGLGLGMAIVKTVLEAMGSEIRFSHAPTRFQFSLEEMRV